LVFRKWRQSDDLSENKLGFLEPSGGEALALEEIGVILMPLVAWDGLGARLGMGAGYYDKALAPIRDQSTPLRIGIAFDLQKSDGIPTDTHDVPLHELISDSQRFTFPT
jgi:5-formyltetrahydrofolate cyclo-ligase